MLVFQYGRTPSRSWGFKIHELFFSFNKRTTGYTRIYIHSQFDRYFIRWYLMFLLFYCLKHIYRKPWPWQYFCPSENKGASSPLDRVPDFYQNQTLSLSGTLDFTFWPAFTHWRSSRQKLKSLAPPEKSWRCPLKLSAIDTFRPFNQFCCAQTKPARQ